MAARLSLAAVTTASGVKPYSLNSSAPDAEAPKCSSETIRPASPTYSRQPCFTPASTLTRALTLGGITESR